ncbi:MAG: hypothetical protein BMS9Abin05_2715 [Rhodothermia bacterium]|nr:MAG: hypothetical protein BMS9Abin05_2715 [Rhodothermia bacterium]
MQILLDENIPRKLKYRLGPNHEVTTVQEKGWAGFQNGALLDAAEGEFEVFITLDQNLEYQQDLEGRPLSIVIIRSSSSAYLDLLPIVPSLLSVLAALKPGMIEHVTG